MKLLIKTVSVVAVLAFSSGAFAKSSAEKKIAKLEARAALKIERFEVKYADDPVKLAEVVVKVEQSTEDKVTQIEERPSPN